MNPYKGAAGELTTDHFQMIRNIDQVKDKYKARINEGEKCQNILKGALKGRTLTEWALHIYSVSVLGK